MRSARVGSLCFGVGGIDLGLRAAIGAETAWYAETDEDASYVAAKHFAGVPNYGDIRCVDWSAVPTVDIVAAGIPCQPISVIGRKKAQEDERWLWPDSLNAIRALTPRQVFLENVHNITSINNGAILHGILSDLRSAGYASRWTVLGACVVGAPHHRHRWFLLADYVGERAPQAVRIGDRAHCGAPRTSGRKVLPSPRASDGIRGRGNLGQVYTSGGITLGGAVAPGRWADYADAVSRWECLTGEPVPVPTEPGRRDGLRLSRYLPEWMMGLPAGWVTDHMDRATSIRLAGNSVVPDAARAAYDLLAT